MKKMAEHTEKITEAIRDGAQDIFANEIGVLSHLGEYIEEPFTIIESYFRGQHCNSRDTHVFRWTDG